MNPNSIYIDYLFVLENHYTYYHYEFMELNMIIIL